MFKKIFDYIKVFFSGFHYAVKNYDIIKDNHFHTYTHKSSITSKYGSNIHFVYRRGIKIGRLYFLYRHETLAFFYLTLGIIILITF